MTSVILAAVLIAGCTGTTEAKHDPDTVFARPDRTREDVLERFRAAAGKPVDLVDADVELLGISHVDGEAAYKLKVHHGCDVEYRWIDMKSFGELKRATAEQQTAKSEVRGKGS